jgi:prolipoprotein diacylglyceryltransferase
MNEEEYHRRETARKYAFEVGGVGAAGGLIGVVVGALAGSDKKFNSRGSPN